MQPVPGIAVPSERYDSTALGMIYHILSRYHRDPAFYVTIALSDV